MKTLPRYYVYRSGYSIQLRDRKTFSQWPESTVAFFPTLGGGVLTHYTNKMALNMANKLARHLNQTARPVKVNDEK